MRKVLSGFVTGIADALIVAKPASSDSNGTRLHPSVKRPSALARIPVDQGAWWRKIVKALQCSDSEPSHGRLNRGTYRECWASADGAKRSSGLWKRARGTKFVARSCGGPRNMAQYGGSIHSPSSAACHLSAAPLPQGLVAYAARRLTDQLNELRVAIVGQRCACMYASCANREDQIIARLPRGEHKSPQSEGFSQGASGMDREPTLAFPYSRCQNLGVVGRGVKLSLCFARVGAGGGPPRRCACQHGVQEILGHEDSVCTLVSRRAGQRSDQCCEGRQPSALRLPR